MLLSGPVLTNQTPSVTQDKGALKEEIYPQVTLRYD